MEGEGKWSRSTNILVENTKQLSWSLMEMLPVRFRDHKAAISSFGTSVFLHRPGLTGHIDSFAFILVTYCENFTPVVSLNQTLYFDLNRFHSAWKGFACHLCHMYFLDSWKCPIVRIRDFDQKIRWESLMISVNVSRKCFGFTIITWPASLQSPETET